MKKIFASILALTMTAAMLTSCGDSDSSSKSESSSKKEETTTTTTTAETTTTAAETEAPAESSEAPAESGADEEAEAPKDISEMPETLANLEGASVVFDTSKTADDYGLACMAENDWDGTDESHCEFTIEEVAGVPMMKVSILDFDEDAEAYKIPKIRFNMAKLFEGHTADLPKIFTVKADIVTKAVGNFTADDGTESLVPGNFMGAFVTQPGESEDSLGWNQLYEFGESEWVSEWGSYELVMRPGIKPDAVFADTDTAQYLTIMRWSIPNDACFYIADLRFEDEDGNVIECPGFGK